MAKDWHRNIYQGVAVPISYYVGEIRDSDNNFPNLNGYEVVVGTKRGVLSQDVPAQFDLFEQRMGEAVSRLDPVIAPGVPPTNNADVHSIVVLCATAHGEWIRIHPFANGNGRTARLWANWVAVRYGLPPYVRLKPRPAGALYGVAAQRSMGDTPDHSLTTLVFHDMLRDRLRRSKP
jgi:hypothetical protein